MEVSNKINQTTNEYRGNDYFKESNSNPMNSDPTTSEPLSALQLDIPAITELIETVLSTEKLQSDVVSYMTKSGDTMALHLSSLMLIPAIKKLNINEEDLVSALKNSKLSYDESAKIIKIGIKVERKTVILLNAPVDVTAEEVYQFFGELSSEITEAKKELETTWFITFKDESSATDAVINCIGKKLNDVKVNVRMKSENLVKNTNVGPFSNFNSQVPMNPSQNYPSYKNEYNPKNRNNQRFRRGNRKHNSRSESDNNQSSLQIMGNGDLVYTKRNNFSSKGGKQNGNIKERKTQPKRLDKKSNYQAPPLGVSHFPPLGKKWNNNDSRMDSRQYYNLVDEAKANNLLSNSQHEIHVDNDPKEDVSELELNNNKRTDETNDVQEVNGVRESNQEIINEANKLMEGLLNGNDSNVEEFNSKDERMRPNWAEIAKARNNQS